MTLPELRRLNGVLTALWPGQGWPDSTLAVVLPQLAAISYELGEKAIKGLLHDGERFPVPAVVIHRCEQLAEAESRRREALPPPDAIRDATPEEQQRVLTWRARLKAATDRLAARKVLAP